MAEPQVDPQLVDQTRKEIARLISEIEHLANQELPPGEFYAEAIRRTYTALAARAVALWMRTPQGNLQLQFQVNMQQLGLDESARPGHDELLRFIVNKQESTIVAPASGPGDLDAPLSVQNPTPYLLVLAPVLVDGETVGVVELFQDAGRRSAAHQGYQQFLKRVAAEIGKFIKNGRYRIILGQQAQWNQVEAFIRTIHGGLNPTQVAYLIANEGKRLIQCERVSVAVRRGKKTRIVAISGQDVVERRANLVRRMTALADKVIQHGENLVYNGAVHEHWPGDVRAALEEYVEESGSKLIVVVPMRDDREFADHKGRSDAALLCEMVEDPAEPDELAPKIDVVGRHASVALANALEHSDVFLLPLWKAIGKSTRWMRGRGLPKVVAVLAAVGALSLFLAFYPYPLRLEGRGELVPENRQIVFAPSSGTIKEVKVDHGDPTEEMATLALMENTDLDRQLAEIKSKLEAKEAELRSLQSRQTQENKAFDPELATEIGRVHQEAASLEVQRNMLELEMEKLAVRSPMRGTVMDWKPKEKLLRRPVEKGNPLLTIADVSGPWIVEVRIPESAITHIRRAQHELGEKLNVEFVLTASPDTVHRGVLRELGSQAAIGEDGNYVEAKIEFEGDEALMKLIRPQASESDGGRGRAAMVSGVEVRAKVNCGDHSLGYVLFHELIDFIREYVFF